MFWIWVRARCSCIQYIHKQYHTHSLTHTHTKTRTNTHTHTTNTHICTSIEAALRNCAIILICTFSHIGTCTELVHFDIINTNACMPIILKVSPACLLCFVSRTITSILCFAKSSACVCVRARVNKFVQKPQNENVHLHSKTIFCQRRFSYTHSQQRFSRVITKLFVTTCCYQHIPHMIQF
jgi:hypothetical protein